MVPASLVAYFIERKFPSLPEGKLGTIMASAQFVSSLGNMVASSVARRIGLIKTSKLYDMLYREFSVLMCDYSGIHTSAECYLLSTAAFSILTRIDDCLPGCKIDPQLNGSSTKKCLPGRSRPSGGKDCCHGNSKHRYCTRRSIDSLRLTELQ